MGLDFEYVYGQTPIDEDEKGDLLIETIATVGELNEFEQKNIEDAIQWVTRRTFKVIDVFTQKFICNVHKHMFGSVWAWAGIFRKTDKNIGVDKYQIPVALKMLCDDALYWVENETFPPDEIAVRFKHRLVSIHCFPNGNGRHSRLMGDIIIEKLYGQAPFSWGASDLSEASDIRSNYLQAVKAADQGVYAPLIAFARS